MAVGEVEIVLSVVSSVEVGRRVCRAVSEWNEADEDDNDDDCAGDGGTRVADSDNGDPSPSSRECRRRRPAGFARVAYTCSFFVPVPGRERSANDLKWMFTVQ